MRYAPLFGCCTLDSDPAAVRAGLELRPYDLRHSFVSLLIVEGASIVEIARQAGHSPAVALNVYAHVIEELEGGERRSAETVIREARDSRVPLMCPQAGEAAAE